MKKTLFAVVVLVALVAKADYIYWMVDDNPNGYEWDTAYLVQDNVSANDGRIGQLTSTAAADYKEVGDYAWATLGENYTAASFFIELYKDGKFMAQSEEQAYASVKGSIFGGNPMSPVAAGTSAFVPVGSTYNVPEPTSGLLFLIGGVLLGLKRRRQA